MSIDQPIAIVDIKLTQISGNGSNQYEHEQTNKQTNKQTRNPQMSTITIITISSYFYLHQQENQSWQRDI